MKSETLRWVYRRSTGEKVLQEWDGKEWREVPEFCVYVDDPPNRPYTEEELRAIQIGREVPLSENSRKALDEIDKSTVFNPTEPENLKRDKPLGRWAGR